MATKNLWNSFFILSSQPLLELFKDETLFQNIILKLETIVTLLQNLAVSLFPAFFSFYCFLSSFVVVLPILLFSYYFFLCVF